MKNPSFLEQRLLVPPEYAGLRLDQALARLLPDHSRQRIQQWISRQHVTINGAHWRPRDQVRGGEEVIINAPVVEQTAWSAQALPVPIVAEDEAVLVVNKPAGFVVHPAAGNADNTLANALLHYCPALTQLPRAGIVHRLDKDTSGLLVIAKTLPAHTSLVAQLQARTVHREYYAVVNGVLISGGTIDAAIGRHPRHRQKMAVVNSGKPAVTHYRVVERFRAHTLVKVLLETGRTHQIRVHMAHRGYPLVGDTVYGARPIVPPAASAELIEAIRQFPRQALHARRLEFIHPITQQLAEFTAPLPEDMQHLIKLLQEDAASHYEAEAENE